MHFFSKSVVLKLAVVMPLCNDDYVDVGKHNYDS